MKNIETFHAGAGGRRRRGPGRILAALLCALVVTGCARRYDMMLTNGGRITNVTKPVFDKEKGTFTYKDVAGNSHHVSSGKVVEIKPHSEKNVSPLPQ
jgi:hypothetical protein